MFPSLGPLWVLGIVAWQTTDGPNVWWHLDAETGQPQHAFRFPGERPAKAGELAVLQRALSLIVGAPQPRGPKLGAGEAVQRSLADQAERLLADHPDLPLRQIAKRLHVGERSLRRYRSRARALDSGASGG